MGADTKYLDSLGDLARWYPEVEPGQIDASKMGMRLGGGAGIGTQMADFIPAVAQPLWLAFPKDTRDKILSGVLAAASDYLTIAAPLASAVGKIIPILEAIGKMPGIVAGMIEGQMKANDQARYDARLKYWSWVEELPPSSWIWTPPVKARYTRKRKFNKDVHPIIYPPMRVLKGLKTLLKREEYAGPLVPRQYPVYLEPEKPGCIGGCSDYSGGRGTCQTPVMTFPMFYPLWSEGSFGYGSKDDKGMERAYVPSGQAPQTTALALQILLLTSVTHNLRCDGRDVLYVWEYFREFFFDRLGKDRKIGPGAMSLYPGETAQFDIEIDAKFNPDAGLAVGGKNRFYWTPSGLIGAYVGGRGSLESDELKKYGVWRWEGTFRRADCGGNSITFADYNAIATVVATFFSFRAAILRRKSIAVSIVEDVPELLTKSAYDRVNVKGKAYYVMKNGMKTWAIPEAKVRNAIEDLAAREDEPLGAGQLAMAPGKKPPRSTIAPRMGPPHGRARPGASPFGAPRPRIGAAGVATIVAGVGAIGTGLAAVILGRRG